MTKCPRVLRDKFLWQSVTKCNRLIKNLPFPTVAMRLSSSIIQFSKYNLFDYGYNLKNLSVVKRATVPLFVGLKFANPHFVNFFFVVLKVFCDIPTVSAVMKASPISKFGIEKKSSSLVLYAIFNNIKNASVSFIKLSVSLLIKISIYLTFLHSQAKPN